MKPSVYGVFGKNRKYASYYVSFRETNSLLQNGAASMIIAPVVPEK